LDTTDPQLTFDEKGVCSACHTFDRTIAPRWHPGTQDSLRALNAQIKEMKESQKHKEYDAIIGLSGGVDSSYLAYWARKVAGLRLLAVHVDAGWNSELAVQNIECIVKKLGIELHTHVVDWEAMRDVQLAFFKAGVANQDTPQDHAFFSVLYSFAVKNGIRYVLNGSNLATESILPSAWGYDAMDSRQVRDICRTFGAPAFKKFPLTSFFKYHIYFPYIRRMTIVRPLNALDYHKNEAIKVLEKELGWQYYGGKHYESRFTKFFQGFWLPKKYGYDKRKAHLSSMILAGQITREDALKELEKPSYDVSTVEEDIAFVAKKLEIPVAEFLKLMAEPNRSYNNFKTNESLKNILRMMAFGLKKLMLR
jgi:N-acetyl sugar amidotransferase